MARFIFKLDGVLEHRKHLERERQRDLAAVQQQMAILQAELKELNDSMTVSTQDVRSNHLVGKLDLNLLAAHRRYVTATQRKAATLVQRMSRVQKQIDEARIALAEAAKQRKVIEKLRERYEARWREDQTKKEMSELDEIATRLGFCISQEDQKEERTGAELRN